MRKIKKMFRKIIKNNKDRKNNKINKFNKYKINNNKNKMPFKI
jgi:hypothetical protein